MLKLDTRYVLRHKDNEKVISIKTVEDLNYWGQKEKETDYIFTEIMIYQMKAECESCSA